MSKFGLLDYDWTGGTEYLFLPNGTISIAATQLWGRDTTRLAVWCCLTTVFDLITPGLVILRARNGNVDVPLVVLSQQSPSALLRLCDYGPVLQEALSAQASGAGLQAAFGYWRPTGMGGA